MNFSSDFLDQIRARIPLKGKIERKIKLTKRGRLFLGLCPFHQEKTPSFTVYEDQETYHCFGCGVHGDLFSFTMHTEGLDFPEAVKRLAEEAHIPLPAGEQTQEYSSEKKQIYESLEAACTWFQEQLRTSKGLKAYDYLKNRLLQDPTISQFRLGYAPAGNLLKKHLLSQGFKEKILLQAGLLHENTQEKSTYDYFRDRLMFPILERNGKVIGFGGRILDQGEPKYLNSPDTPVFHKRNTLYGLSFLNREKLKEQPLIVCEGYMDVIALSQEGFQGVAPLGTSMTEEQILLLWKLSIDPVLCFDGDTAGKNAAIRAAHRALPFLKPGFSLRFIQLPQGEDPDSLMRQGMRSTFETLLVKATPLSDFLWQTETYGKNFETPEKKALLQKNLFENARIIKDSSVQKFYLEDFERKLIDSKLKAGFSYLKSAKYTKKEDGGAFMSFKKTPLPLDPSFIQLKILFATIINYPQILQEVAEPFASLEIEDKQLSGLRDEIFFAINEKSDLDGLGLKHHLKKAGYDEVLSKILCNGVYVHAAFSTPQSSVIKALIGWKEIWKHLCETKFLAKDMKTIQKQLSNTMSKDIWSKMRYLNELTKTNKLEHILEAYEEPSSSIANPLKSK
jgi:DNA primase